MGTPNPGEGVGTVYVKNKKLKVKIVRKLIN